MGWLFDDDKTKLRLEIAWIPYRDQMMSDCWGWLDY